MYELCPYMYGLLTAREPIYLYIYLYSAPTWWIRYTHTITVTLTHTHSSVTLSTRNMRTRCMLSESLLAGPLHSFLIYFINISQSLIKQSSFMVQHAQSKCHTQTQTHTHSLSSQHDWDIVPTPQFYPAGVAQLYSSRVKSSDNS